MFIDIILIILILVCVFTDLTERKIYNKVLFPAVILAFCYHIYTAGFNGGYFSLKGLLIGMALLLVPYLMGGIGAGDVKFLGVIGALKGPVFIFTAFLSGAIAGGVMAIFYLLKNKKMLFTLKKLFSPFFFHYGLIINKTENSKESNITIPYGAAIAIGATVAAYFAR
ncbi:MAG: A24 family peptidase [Desulfotomaculaceae bacterium]